MTDLSPDVQGLLDESYESDLTEEESEQLLSMCGHGIGSKISPAAQAVLDAYRSTHLSLNNLAAALRAAASQLTSAKAIDQLRAIAAELEGNA